jgi:hypothetical protein
MLPPEEVAALLNSQRLPLTAFFGSVTRHQDGELSGVGLEATARRPWLTAAAGLLIGCLTTSMVSEINHRGWTENLRRILLPLVHPGSERQETLPQTHLVPVHGQWSGIGTEILSGNDGLQWVLCENALNPEPSSGPALPCL